MIILRQLVVVRPQVVNPFSPPALWSPSAFPRPSSLWRAARCPSILQSRSEEKISYKYGTGQRPSPRTHPKKFNAPWLPRPLVTGQGPALRTRIPHIRRVLGREPGRRSLRTKSIDLSHVESAISKAIEQAQQTTHSTYHRAIMSPRKDNIFAQVLLACALTKTDSLGYFAAADVRVPLTKIMGKPYEVPGFSRHLNDFCEPERGPILHKIGKIRRYRFRFINPLLQPFVIMQGIASRLIDRKTFGDS